MSEYYRWWEDDGRTIVIYNKSEMAGCLEKSLKTIDTYIRQGAPVFGEGSNGKEYRLDAVAFVEWVRARRAGISAAELRTRDEADPVCHLLQAWFRLEMD
jgi:phage terminase Nu1 subunit (DNA packaging protein)